MNISKYIFREFNKINDKYIATNKFFISSLNENGKTEYNLLNKNIYQQIIESSNNLYIHVHNNYNNYINLILISNISFSLNDININKSYIIKKSIEDDILIDDILLEDMYYNESFSKKINLNIPKQYNTNINILTKYLFKINITEINQSFYQENNKLVLI